MRGRYSMNHLSEADYTIAYVDRLFPPESKPTKFDKGIDLIKALSCTTVPGVIGQVLETGIKAYQSIKNTKYRCQAVKYVSNMYEVQKFSEIELKRLELESERNKTVSLYIDKTFQCEIDRISKEHTYKMSVLKNEHDTAIHRIDAYTKVELARINKTYAAIVREQEFKCVMYRQFLKQMYFSKVTPADLIAEASKQYFAIAQKAYERGDGDSSSTQAVFESILDYLRFVQDYNGFVPFSEYIKVLGGC